MGLLQKYFATAHFSPCYILPKGELFFEVDEGYS